MSVIDRLLPERGAETAMKTAEVPLITRRARGPS